MFSLLGVLHTSEDIMTSRTPIRDRQNTVLGWIEGPDHLGRTRLLDRTNRTLGWYISNRNITIDHRAQTIGQGDQLLRLMKDRRSV
jgi:hypothetical protein